VAPLTTQNSGPTGSSTRTSSQGLSCCQAQSSMPTSRRRLPLPRCTSSEPARVQVGLGEHERLVDPQPGAPGHDGQAAQRRPWTPSPAWRITVTISSIVGGSAG
jgi:hypothetical protein